METSFLELRCKDVINVVDGRRLGHAIDVVFNLENGCLIGLVVPSEKNSWNPFKKAPEFLISLSQIVKVGEDAILVEIYGSQQSSVNMLSMSKKKHGS